MIDLGMPGKPINRTFSGTPNKLTLTVPNLVEARLTVDASTLNLDPARLAGILIEEHYRDEENIKLVKSRAIAEALLRGLTLEQYLRLIITNRVPDWEPSWRTRSITAEKICFTVSEDITL